MDPASDGRMVRLQTAFAEQFFDITERERVPQVPAHGAKNQLGSVCRHLKIAGRIVFFMIASGYQPPSAKVATQPIGVEFHYSKPNELADKGADRYFIDAFRALRAFAGVVVDADLG